MLQRPISKHYPALAPIVSEIKIATKSVQYYDKRYFLKKTSHDFLFKVYESKSLLHRKLGDSSPKLQEAKVENLKLAVPKFDGLELKPNQILSFWKILGRPTYAKGFVDGMLLADGKVITGVGGGLCQLANMLYWLFLHAPVKIKEHHHHSYDVFPDSGRVLPFGSGAGTLFNYYDLQLHNSSTYSLKLNVWLDDKFLYGKITSNTEIPYTFKVVELEHHFYKRENKNYRGNKLYKRKFDRKTGNLLSEVLIKQNDAEVMYPIQY